MIFSSSPGKLEPFENNAFVVCVCGRVSSILSIFKNSDQGPQVKICIYVTKADTELQTFSHYFHKCGSLT